MKLELRGKLDSTDIIEGPFITAHAIFAREYTTEQSFGGNVHSLDLGDSRWDE
jgi:hypothetical protein